MSTFSQWWLSFKKKPSPRQVTWICGTEPVLVDEVSDLIKSSLKPDPINMVYLDAREDSERAIWNELRQHPFGANAIRLTIVRGAEKIQNDAAFIQYLKDRASLPRNYVVFVSGEPALRKDQEDNLWPGHSYLKTRGSIVECRPFTATSAKHAVEWVKQKANIQGRAAEHLLNSSAGDLRLVRDTMRKLSVFPGEITLKVISEMFEERPSDSFLGALFSLDRKTALKALTEVPREDYSRMLGLVDARLDLAGQVHDMLIDQKSSADIARAAGNKGFLVPEMLPIAKHYDKKRRQRIRNYLAVLDSYTQYGVPEGALEALVILW